MPDDNCNKRLEKLEASVSACAAHREMRDKADRDVDARFNRKIEVLQEDVTDIKEFMIQQKSFIGALVIIVGGIYGVVTLFADKLLK